MYRKQASFLFKYFATTTVIGLLVCSCAKTEAPKVSIETLDIVFTGFGTPFNQVLIRFENGKVKNILETRSYNEYQVIETSNYKPYEQFLEKFRNSELLKKSRSDTITSVKSNCIDGSFLSIVYSDSTSIKSLQFPCAERSATPEGAVVVKLIRNLSDSIFVDRPDIEERNSGSKKWLDSLNKAMGSNLGTKRSRD